MCNAGVGEGMLSKGVSRGAARVLRVRTHKAVNVAVGSNGNSRGVKYGGNGTITKGTM